MVPTDGLRAQDAEEKALKNAMVRYILNVATKKTPIKSNDIVKQALRGESKWFARLLPAVEETLSDIYGLRIVEIKERSGKFYLVTSEVSPGSEAELTTSQRQEIRLLFLVLSYIFMKGGRIIEPVLFTFLAKLHIEEEPHEYFGEFKKLITDTFVKQMYLKKEKVEMEAGTMEERFQYSWGHRAELEFKKSDCLQFAADLLKRPVTSFATQYEECQSDSEDVDMEAEN